MAVLPPAIDREAARNAFMRYDMIGVPETLSREDIKALLSDAQYPLQPNARL